MAGGQNVIFVSLIILPFCCQAMSLNQMYQSIKLQIRNPQGLYGNSDLSSSSARNGYINNVVDNVDYSNDDEAMAAGLMEQPHLEQSIGEDCTTFPNNTRVAPHFFSCSSQSTPLIHVHDAAITNATGDDHFPVDFSQEVRFFFDVTSSAKRRYDNLGVKVNIYKRSTGWFGCGWLYLPSFGLISDYHLCDENPSCPVAPGRQVFEITINPSILFSGFFKMFHSDQVPYQLVLRVRNNRHPFEELFCMTFQTRIHY